MNEDANQNVNSNEPTNSNTDNGNQNQNTNSGADNQNTNQNTNQQQSFSQADLNRVGAQEKANGKRAMLKELGFENEDAAKSAMAQFKAWQDSQKTEEQKTAEKLKNAAQAQSVAEQRAEAAERKLEILKANGNPKFIDDIMVLVSARINDKTDFNEALKSVQTAYPSFFNESSEGNNDTGTGSGMSHRRQNSQPGTEGIGARLAKNRTKATSAKNPYFNN